MQWMGSIVVAAVTLQPIRAPPWHINLGGHHRDGLAKLYPFARDAASHVHTKATVMKSSGP